MIVYVVTSGSYSDFGIEAMFSTRELAQSYIDTVGADDYREIEEWTLDERTGTDRIWWLVFMNYDSGNDASTTPYWGEDKSGKEPWVHNYTSYRSFGVYVRAASKEQAIKAANERRTQHKALYDAG